MIDIIRVGDDVEELNFLEEGVKALQENYDLRGSGAAKAEILEDEVISITPDSGEIERVEPVEGYEEQGRLFSSDREGVALGIGDYMFNINYTPKE